jgi:hypothetical protein
VKCSEEKAERGRKKIEGAEDSCLMNREIIFKFKGLLFIISFFVKIERLKNGVIFVKLTIQNNKK